MMRLHFDPAPDDWAIVKDNKTGKPIGWSGVLNGVRHGPCWMVNEQGTIQAIGEYRYGRLHGDWKYYDSQRRMVRIEKWEDDVLLGGCRSPVWVGKSNE